jgi:N-acylneuraminate cytidylyltransferase
MMKIYGFIFARGGSKGIPNKNICDLCGKPLIAYAIEAGLKTGRLDRIIVSTDSEEIADIARAHGAEAPFMRPAELAADHSPEWLAWRHAVGFLEERGEKFDVFVSLPATAPLRTPEDVVCCLETYLEGNCDSVITCTAAHRSPYFNMITIGDGGMARLGVQGERIPARRQDAPKMYDVATVAYVCSPAFIMKEDGLWAGRVKAMEIPKEHAIDIDEPLDLEFAEFLMRKRLAKD